MSVFNKKKDGLEPPLDTIAILKEVPRRALRAARKEGEWYAVPAGWPLFKAGDVSDSIYFILTGTFGAFRQMPDGRDEFMGHIRAGEPAGEMALFQNGQSHGTADPPTDAFHSSSVYALRDSEVFKLSRKSFQKLINAEPEILSGVIRLIVARLKNGELRNPRTAPKVFSLVATSPSIDIGQRAQALATSLKRLNVRARIVFEDEGREKPAGFFDQLESENDIVILVSTMGENSWFKLAMRQADRIWVVARADARPSDPIFPKTSSPAQAMKLIDVLLIHYPGYRQASKPSDWLQAAGASRIFHWTNMMGESSARLARTMAGRSVGVVLSGGGARAYAHIGAIRAIRELGIPVDFIGGTSMGAVIAACVAKGWDIQEIETRIRKAFVATNPLGDWHLPVVGLVKGRKVDARLLEHFGNSEINDLEIPFFASSTSLSTGLVRVHRSGSLRAALRASISLPGILPPVVEDDQILVDGAVLNNFPADIMAKFHRGLTIGADVTRTDRGLKTESFIDPPGFFGWVARHGLSSMPPIAELLMRSATLTNDPTNGHEDVDALILPELGEIELRDWKAYDECVEAGYSAAMKALHNSGFVAQLNLVTG
ncbi:MAG: patatin-like phospholipase family protein [Henriciella sp.]